MDKDVQKNAQYVLKENPKAKDSFFGMVDASEERVASLARFLMGERAESVRVRPVRPIIFGNKENDVAFLCDDALYYMVEAQSSVCGNMPWRMLEYITAGLRSFIPSAEKLYGSGRILFPVPLLYVVQTGLVRNEGALPKAVEYGQCLSDSFRKHRGRTVTSGLELKLHVFDFRMTYGEVFRYVEDCEIPFRINGYDTELLQYALVANSVAYLSFVRRNGAGQAPRNAKNLGELCRLFAKRGLFVEIFEDKEACNMAIATFSREEELRMEGRVEGRSEGIELALRLLKQRGCDIGNVTPEELIFGESQAGTADFMPERVEY